MAAPFFRLPSLQSLNVLCALVAVGQLVAWFYIWDGDALAPLAERMHLVRVWLGVSAVVVGLRVVAAFLEAPPCRGAGGIAPSP